MLGCIQSHSSRSTLVAAAAAAGVVVEVVVVVVVVKSDRKVKCTLVQALRLCTGRTAHRGSRGISLLFLDHGTRRG
jgi:hypothetical protein